MPPLIVRNYKLITTIPHTPVSAYAIINLMEKFISLFSIETN